MSDDDKKDDKVENIKGKNPTEKAINTLAEAEKKKKAEELKKAIEEVLAAKKVLTNAVEKAQGIEEELKDLDNNKLNLDALANALDI